MKLFQDIVYAQPDVTMVIIYFIKFSPKLQDLVKKLLCKESSKRLGTNGAKQVREHPWFEKVSFDAIYNKKIKAPCAPILKNHADTANFDVQFTSCPVHSYQ